MARPQKIGLDYFPLDVDIDQDDKVALIEAQHGLKGFAIVIKLLMKIYKNSYFYEWTKKEQLLFSKRVNVDINDINVVINDCIEWGLFDSELYKNYKILTSSGIQRRFLEAVGRRQKVKIDKNYLLLDDETVNVYKNLVIVDINTNSSEDNSNINPQSKEKKSKVKESKGEERKEPPKTEPITFPSPISEKIYNLVGEVGYRTWFIDTEITEDDNSISIKVSDDFKKEIIKSKYCTRLQTELNKKIDVS